MSDEQAPGNVEPGEPETVPAAPAATAPERYPFWGYSDLLLFAGMTIPSMLIGFGMVRAVMWAFHIHPAVRVAELLPEQFLGYAILFSTLMLMFRAQYKRPFWRSLGWVPSPLPLFWVVLAGMTTAIGVALVSSLVQTPNTSNPMTELLQDRTSVILIAIFGITLGPLCEELAFRGFLQPLLVRSLGAVAGILAAAIPFGLLHFQEYGNSWRHALVISLAGAAFGWMRQATGSTKASTIMHAAYNALFFVALFAQRKQMAHPW
jgi:membrane protease YdiL (CAAX protease family)